MGEYCTNVVMKARDRRWSWLRHVLRMSEHRLVRQVLLNCAILPTEVHVGIDGPEMLISVPGHSVKHYYESSSLSENWEYLKKVNA